jgi:phenylalanyl-tRNA synthetase beta chain
MDAVKLCEVFKTDNKMKKFLPILEGHDKYPVFLDANRQVLSLPPLINSEATKITLDTKNVFIEVTAEELNKAQICLAILASQFSTHCKGEWKHKVEQVKITHETDSSKDLVTPVLEYFDMDVEIEYINRLLGLDLDQDQIKECASKMGLTVKSFSAGSAKVEVPPIRADILHPCDIVEDIGIGFGFNNVPRVFPPTNTVGMYQPANKFQDLLRAEIAQAGYIECLTMSLLSFKDNYENMRLPTDLNECVQVGNPKTLEFEMVRTTLIPGLLKTLKENKNEPIPQKVFEISDCVVLSNETDTGAVNVRKIAALSLDMNSNFEVIHGLLDLLMCKVYAQ